MTTWPWPACLNDDELEDALKRLSTIHPFSRLAVIEEVIKRWRRK